MSARPPMPVGHVSLRCEQGASGFQATLVVCYHLEGDTGAREVPDPLLPAEWDPLLRENGVVVTLCSTCQRSP